MSNVIKLDFYSLRGAGLEDVCYIIMSKSIGLIVLSVFLF